jgi:hypothetical protein
VASLHVSVVEGPIRQKTVDLLVQSLEVLRYLAKLVVIRLLQLSQDSGEMFVRRHQGRLQRACPSQVLDRQCELLPDQPPYAPDVSGQAASDIVLAVAFAVLIAGVSNGIRRKRRGRRVWPWLVFSPLAAFAVALAAVFAGPP